MQGAGEGTHDRHAVRRRRPSRPAPPRREEDRHEDPVRARAVPEVPERRSGEGADPGAAGRPLHDGRRPHRHQRRDAAARPVRRRRGAPASASTAPTGSGSNSLPELLVFGARAGRAAAEYAVAQQDLECRPCSAQAQDEQRRLERRPPARRPAAASASPRSARRCRRRWRRAPASTAPAARWRKAATQLRQLQERLRRTSRSRTTAGRSTPNVSTALELSFMLDVAEAIVHSALRREESRGAHQRTDFPGARRPALPRALAGLPAGRRLVPRSSTCRSRSPAGRRPSGSMGRLHPMSDRITLQVARYRPEQESEATFDEYEVPCPKEWVVLDGLNHIKDRLDGTLSYRWSCRMGICGSCGMTVNGEPKLTCATFLSDYAPGPVRVEPLRNFPIIRDLIVDIDDFMRKLMQRQALDHPRERRSRCPRASTCRRPRSWTSTSSSACASTACCATRRARSTAWIRSSSGRPRSRSRSATTSTPATRAPRSGMDVLSEHEGIWGCTFVGECTQGLPEARRSGRRHPALQADARRWSR